MAESEVMTLLTELEAERAELDATIALLRRRLGFVSNGDGANTSGAAVGPSGNVGRDMPVTGRVRSDEFFRLSIADAIAKYLGIMKQPQNPMAIVNGLKSGGVLTNAKNFYANVNTELKRMRGRGMIVNTPSGWGLSEWYPQKPKGNDAQTPSKKKVKKKVKKEAKTEIKKSPAPKASSSAAPTPATNKGGWAKFAGERIAAGKTMKEAAEEWKQRKAANG
jgi:hypothetical protein